MSKARNRAAAAAAPHHLDDSAVVHNGAYDPEGHFGAATNALVSVGRSGPFKTTENSQGYETDPRKLNEGYDC